MPPTECPTAENTATMICCSCGESKPLDQFRRRRKGEERREARCRPCFNQYTKERRQRQRGTEVKRFVSQLNRASSWGRIVELCEAMFRRFKGPGGVAAIWAEELQKARRESPARALRSLKVLVRLMGEIEDRRPPAEPLSDADAEAIIQQQLIDLITKRPRIAVLAAESLGWMVIPPRESAVEGAT